MKKTPTPERISLRVPAETARRIDRLLKRTEAVSIAEVVRNALKVYESTLNKKETA